METSVSLPPQSKSDTAFVKVRNPGRRTYLAVGVTVAVVLVLASVHAFVATTYFTPQRAVAGYFDALAARDARLALSFLVPLETDGLLLTDQVIKNEGYRPPANMVIGDVPAEGDVRTVPLSFELDGKTHELRVLARRAESRTLGVFRGWLIEGGLFNLDIAVPRAVKATVNGVTLPNAETTIATFPGQYRVGIADHPMLQARETIATVTGRQPAVRVTTTLKDTIRGEVEAQVRSYVDECARSVKLEPAGCPFGVPSSTTVTNVKWTVTTYPTLSVTINSATGVVNVGTSREGRADVTGTNPDGTAFSRFDTFRVTGSAALVDGKVRFTR